MDEGKLYEIQPDLTYSLFDVKYDFENDLKKGIKNPSDQVPIFKNLIS